MPVDPVDQLRTLGNSFDELVPPVTMNDLRGRPSRAGRGRVAVRVFATAAAVVTFVAVGAIVLSRSDDDVVPADSAPITSVIADDEIAGALAAWKASGPSSYNLSVATTSPIGLITIQCEFHVDGSTGHLIRGPIRTAANDAPSQIPDLSYCDDKSTVEDLLEMISRHRSEGHDVPTTFDDDGVPIKFTLDADLAAVDGSKWVEVTVSEPLVLPTVTLTADDQLICGPTDGAWVRASVSSELVGLTARVVVDDRVIASSKPTESVGTVDVSFDPAPVSSDALDPYGKVGELQVINADGYVLATQQFTMANASGVVCG